LESIEISDFGKTIYAYLRLEDVPNLIERLNKLIEEQKEEERLLEGEIEEERRKITDELEKLQVRLTSFLQDPPWGDAEPPTWTETREKIEELIKQLGQQTGQEPPEDLNEEILLDLAQKWTQDLAAPKEEELNEKFSEMKERQSAVKEFHRELEEKNQAIEDRERQIEEIERKRRDILDDKDPDELRKELEDIDRKIEQTSLLIDIIKKSQLYLENHEAQECFICSTEVDKEELRGNIEQRLEQVEPDKLQNIQRRDELEALLGEVTRLEEELGRVKQTLEQYQIEYGEIESSLCEILNLGREELTPEKIESFLKGLETQIAELEQSLESEQEYRRNWERKIERAREETRFHRYRSKKERFETLLEIGLKPVEGRFDELVEFRGSLEEIRQVLSSELKEVLRRALPPINKMMTEVYKHLTNQVSFDLVQIELREQNGDFSPKLLVHVASSDDPDIPPLDPEQVLNGQALNALRLVPYFVFSRFQRDAWGLDLLILDDPTQSFDVQRIELLLKELGTAANHAQLILCTHEKDRFTPLLSEFFEEDQIAITHVKGFNIREGPHIEMG
jgi:DNA repair exonuclease SbcCD ATPase subunit